MYKIFVVMVCMILLVSSNISHVYAKSTPVISRREWHADESLISGVKKPYAAITSITIADFTPSDITSSTNIEDYVQGLYYYLASVYNQDIPYTYAVGWDGHIYEGAAGGSAVVSAGAKGSVVIAYIDNGSGLTVAGANALSSLLLTLHTQTGIGTHDIASAAINFSNNSFTLQAPSASWASSVDGIKTSLHSSIPDASSLVLVSVSIKNITTTKSQDGNETVNATIENTSSLPLVGRLYVGSDTDSPLFVSSLWLSTQRALILESTTIAPNGTQNVSFEINGSLKQGNYTLNLYTDVAKISGSSFAIQIASSGIQVTSSSSTQSLTITSTPTGYVNVHTDHALGSTVIGKVNKGQTFQIQNQYTDNTGQKWFQILYDTKNSGWIVSTYAAVS